MHQNFFFKFDLRQLRLLFSKDFIDCLLELLFLLGMILQLS